MEYRQLGRTGIGVSVIGLGVMSFGAVTNEADAFRQMDMAFERGITLFDTAENYPAPPVSAETQGRSEEILGRWVSDRGLRDRVVIATKVAGPEGGPAGALSYLRGADRCLDRKNIRMAIDDSLRRLATDYVDLYQVHWPSRRVSTHGRDRFSNLPDIPGQITIEETLAALSELVNEGKVRAVGVSNETAWGIMRYLAAADAQGFPRIASTQNGYSLLERRFEHALAETAMREQVGLVAYSPLARGLLSNKIRDGATIVSSRLSQRRIEIAEMYNDLARCHGLEPEEMALAFVRQQPFTTSVLAAARTVEQLESNLRSLDCLLDENLVKAINGIHDAHPNPK